jgi:hypothetical protein
MKRYITRFLTLWIITFGLAGCAFPGLPADRLPWVGEAPVLFKDDFSSPTGGWFTHEDAVSLAEFHQDAFRIWINVPFYDFWSVPGLWFQDVLVYVRATKQAGPDNNLFGILCRYQDPQNYYALVIGSDGYYGILKNHTGEQTLVDQAHMDFNESIQRGEAANEIQAVCQMDQLALFVNGTPLIQVQDDTFAQGDVGLIAGNFLEPGVDILFDDFIVVKP